MEQFLRTEIKKRKLEDKIKKDSTQGSLIIQNLDGTATDTKKTPWFVEWAMVRYKSSVEIRVLREAEFGKEFQRRPNEEYWQKVEVIQTCIKAKTGCGDPIFIKFTAPMDETDPESEIDYKAHMVHTEDSKKIEDAWPIDDEG